MPPTTPRRRGEEALTSGWPIATALGLAGLSALAAGLRFWRLGRWGLEGDEIFTLRDSITLRVANPRPLLYLLNHYLVRPVVPLDELGLRLLPALMGVLAVPLLYLVGRRLVGSRAALFASLLLVFNPLHVYQSQYARYWSLVFLLSAVYPYVIYLGVRDRNPRTLTLGLVVAVLAALAHPVSVLLLGGLSVWIVAVYLRRGRLTELWRRRSVRWGALVVVLLAAAIAAWLVPVLRSWILAHGGGRATDHFLFFPGRPGVKQVGLILSYVEGLTLPLVLAAALGISWLRQEGERPLALLLTCLFLVPVAFIVLLSFRTAVSATYLLPSAPVVFLGAGVFLDRLAGVASGLRPRWLLPAAVTAIILAAGAPTLLSQYRDGRRRDFQGAARWLDPRLAPGDVVFSDQARVMTHYLPRGKVERLTADTVQLMQAVRRLAESERGGTLWIVAPYSARGGHRTNPKLGSFKEWIYGNCQLRNAVGVARLDFRQNELQIYRCPPAAPAAPARPDGGPAPAGEGDSAAAKVSPFRARTSR